MHHAKELGLTAFALTDHDTTAGLTEAVHAGLREGIDVVPGIEFSTEYRGKDIHILGYCFDYEAEDFQRRIREFADARDLRNRRMCEKLCSAGFPVPYEELMAENKGSIVTRAQFAAYMVQHGIVASREEAFDHYIGDDCPYFVPREKITPEMAVRFLLDFHGVPVLAHPYQYGLPEEELEQLLSHLKSAGLMGLECIYSRYPEDQVRALTRLADQFGLLVTGGSDYHGANKPGLEMGTGYGQLFVPEQCLTALRRTLYHTDEETQVFFADLDGTLLNSEKTVSPRTMDALRRWCAAGNLLVLSSGRALYDCQQVLEELPLRELPGVYIEACNGALLYDCSTHQIIYREGIPRAMLNELFNDCRAHGVYVHTYTDRGIAVRLYRKETKFYQRYHHMTVIEAGLPADSDFVPDAADEEARPVRSASQRMAHPPRSADSARILGPTPPKETSQRSSRRTPASVSPSNWMIRSGSRRWKPSSETNTRESSTCSCQTSGTLRSSPDMPEKDRVLPASAARSAFRSPAPSQPAIRRTTSACSAPPAPASPCATASRRCRT